MIKTLPVTFFRYFIFTFLLGAVSIFYAQEQIGGPYTPDSNTVLLLHFDGNLKNESQFSADGIGHGKLTFLSNAALGLGQCLRINNDAVTDSSYVSVPDTPALNLKGDWTIEGWMNVFTYGTSSSDWRWVPRLIIKAGDEVFWRPNYFVENWGDNRFFSTGYNVEGQDRWPQVNSPNNTLVPGKWFHLTFIRDTSRHILIQMIHDDKRQLISFNTASYDPVLDVPPIQTKQPVTIGFAGQGSTDGWLDGFVDEIRISNVVRNFAVPPIITNLTQIPNQADSVDGYEVGANIMAFASTGSIQSAEIHFSVDGGNTWFTAPMVMDSTDHYTGLIPKQNFGTEVRYYVTATDNQGLTAQQPIAGIGGQDYPYYSFVVYKPNILVLHLNFENGSGTPVDLSPLSNQVLTFGNRTPSYSTNAAEGKYSFLMPDDADSAFLEVPSPFLTMKDFYVSFWFNADSTLEYTRLLNRPIVRGNWYQNNYEIRFEPNARIRARYYVDPNAQNRTEDYSEITLPDSIKLHKWYRVVYRRTDTAAVFMLFDSTNTLLSVGYDSSVAVNPPTIANAPLRIGNGGNLNGIRGFRGLIDDVQIYNNGQAKNTVTGVNQKDASIPHYYELSQNYPNPFNPTTLIRFVIPSAQKVTLSVYDILGRKIKTLVNDFRQPGKYTVVWDGTNNEGAEVASGVYIYRLITNEFIQAKKMMLLR
ncbi:LamG-like jellyroll fold domain-containing protein [Melioribacteraceae bacterium 4301-Me]|uniref:LamG-like jellyroll fold domain-containing protein n=1 Tax=Pyranulibacter aquaticus TaxID=3163344 RepID=UPI0035973159